MTALSPKLPLAPVLLSADGRVLPERPRPPAKFERAPAVVRPEHAQRIAGLLIERGNVCAKYGLLEDAEASFAIAAMLRPLTKPVRLKQRRNMTGTAQAMADLSAQDWLKGLIAEREQAGEPAPTSNEACALA
jgi:hypothetical protein